MSAPTEAERLLDLAARVEAAEGPDRELDCRAWVAKTGGPSFEVCVAVVPNLREWQAPYYTASIDAALTLVPGNCLAMVRHLWDDDHRAGHAVINSYAPSGEEPDGKMWTGDFTAVAHTPALALTAAALRAHAVQGARP